MTDLKPCPFCGGEAEEWDVEGPYISTDKVGCKKCGIYFRGINRVLKWNGRAGE